MSILKSILHHYNKTSASYDTLHPETEVAQITDFADGIVSKLAATTAISAISALQTDSWFGKMMKWVLDASGVKYLIDTNGYVCFGSLFGGLIIQWGMFFNTDGLSALTYPIALSSKPWAIIPTEGDPAGWQASNGIAVAGADLKTASNTQANILTKWVFSNGTMAQGGQTIRVFIIGT